MYTRHREPQRQRGAQTWRPRTRRPHEAPAPSTEPCAFFLGTTTSFFGFCFSSRSGSLQTLFSKGAAFNKNTSPSQEHILRPPGGCRTASSALPSDRVECAVAKQKATRCLRHRLNGYLDQPVPSLFLPAVLGLL